MGEGRTAKAMGSDSSDACEAAKGLPHDSCTHRFSASLQQQAAPAEGAPQLAQLGVRRRVVREERRLRGAVAQRVRAEARVAPQHRVRGELQQRGLRGHREVRVVELEPLRGPGLAACQAHARLPVCPG